jgi:hypothetical protein
MGYFNKILNRVKNRIYFRFKTKISPHSKDIYAIVLMGIYHVENKMECDLATGDIVIKLKDLGYHIIITYNEVIITNHEFPNLGPVEDKVIEKIRTKAIAKISKDRQNTKNEILDNYKKLLKEVKNKVKESDKKARLNLQKRIHEHTNHQE